MVNPVSGKAVTKIITPAVSESLPAQESLKTQPSKFDKVMEQQKGVSVPPEVRALSNKQVQQIKVELNRRLQTTRVSDSREFFQNDITRARNRYDSIQTRFRTLAPPNSPKETGASTWQSGFRDRLVRIEEQFQEADRLIEKVTNIDDHQGLLKAQLEIQKITQNVEILSKIVEQLSSGVKTIVQTQV